MKKLILAVCGWAACFSVHASGFQTNAQSQKALGLGGAYSAISRDAAATYFNPGAMAMLDSGSISLGATYLHSRTAFRSAYTNQVSETDNKPLLPAYFYVSAPISEKFTVGLSINNPYAFNTRWNDNWEGRSVVQGMDLNSYYMQPTIGFKLNENFGIGAGLVYARANMSTRRHIGEINGSSEASVNGSGFGFNAGIYGRMEDKLSFGITYRSQVEMDLNEGEGSFANIPASVSGQFPASAPFQSALTLPSVLSVGISDRISDKMILAFEFNLTGWSTYDSLNFYYTPTVVADIKNPRRYEDAMSFRIGAEYDITESTTLRGGLIYDETPIRDEYISVEIPDGNRLGLTAGITQKIGSRLEIDAAYVFQNVAERQIRTDPSREQTVNIAGKHKTYVNGVGVGINFIF